MLRTLWGIYIGLLSVIGDAVLFLAGFGLCAYATYQQLQKIHDTTVDAGLLAGGIILIASKTVRRLIWTFIALAAPWVGGVMLFAHLTTSGDHSFRWTTPILAICVLPPAFGALVWEVMRRPPVPQGTAELENPDGP